MQTLGMIHIPKNIIESLERPGCGTESQSSVIFLVQNVPEHSEQECNF